MSEYRFTLQKYKPNNKVTCPKCGCKRSAVKYVDTLGEIEFPDSVCLCDRTDKCGYHYPPRDYFHDNPEILRKLMDDGNDQGTYTGSGYCSNGSNPMRQRAPPMATISNPLPVSYIDKDIVCRSLACYSINPLFLFLSRKYGGEKIEKVFRMYNVGTARHWNGATVYWYTDISGRYRTGKVMGYDPSTGHRIKKPYNQVTWAHSLLKLEGFNMQLCLFGEHLLGRYPDRNVAIVEAEKTCLIASYFLPDYIWLATGGKGMGFKSEILKVLSGRNVTLFPDLGCYDAWKGHIPLLQSFCKSVHISDNLERIATDEQKGEGLDISDFLLKDETQYDIFNRMILKYPSLQFLVDKLDLELVEES